MKNKPEITLQSNLICYRGYYVGTSTIEEESSILECCTFQGRFVKLNSKTGAILWQTFMLPNNHNSTGEYAGAAIWGSSTSIDVQRNLIFIATGNLYSIPLHVRRCQESENRQTVPSHPDQCVEPENLSESIIAMDLESGEIKWYKHIGGYDIWFFACDDDLKIPNCPLGPYP